MTYKAALAGVLLMLPACQTIKIQGVEIDRKQQILIAAVAVAAALVIADLEGGDASPEKCAQFLSVPPGKDAPFICAETQ